ncbi:fimbrial biogenesis chaperone [Brevundimonas lenta]|uniref:Fimbrial chaperone protein n=1 Tax=Brevundimonas lenta TaxID=424796 RepID=A0A7W6NQI8_9CAUL|nr:molecular chaperone [Brevundimonas lenta]MBB4083958.1 fimbrial chaperone protein [Brevundimonas lenta]
MPKIGAFAAVIAAAVLVAFPVAAGSLEIGPIRVQMIGPERTATLTIRNVDSAATNVQIRTVDWSQPNGIDDYSPSAVLLASPPLVTLGPGESQVIRLVVEHMPDSPRERAFRLILDEIPPQQEASATGVQTAIRALVPVFVTPSTASRPSLRWTAVRSGDGVVLTAINDGDTRERLIDLQVTVNGQPVVDAPLEGYVLSGGSRAWTLTSGAAQAASLAVSAEGEYGTVQANVPVTP